jgi:hypothetical protein
MEKWSICGTAGDNAVAAGAQKDIVQEAEKKFGISMNNNEDLWTGGEELEEEERGNNVPVVEASSWVDIFDATLLAAGSRSEKSQTLASDLGELFVSGVFPSADTGHERIRAEFLRRRDKFISSDDAAPSAKEAGNSGEKKNEKKREAFKKEVWNAAIRQALFRWLAQKFAPCETFEEAARG